MKKASLEQFINRYNLGGEVESVKITSSDSEMKVSFISDDKTLLGEVTSKEGEFPNGEFGVYTTSQLKALLGVLESSMDVDSTESYIKFSDKGTSVNYMLADLSVIPVVPDLKAVPPMNVQITLDDDFTSKFIKSKGALSESDTFTFECKNNNGEIILGYSSINTNRISMKVDCKCDGDVSPISFSAKYLKEILNANRGSKSANLQISSQGLAHIEFEKDNLTSKYYLVEIK
jgi:DNA polymerase III sliding clamp (beta) subunit (PCNA family)|tara:strand:- start:5125 stop:5820 length:696 start_codon:yes stop_codon:yes gene_type:complete